MKYTTEQIVRGAVKKFLKPHVGIKRIELLSDSGKTYRIKVHLSGIEGRGKKYCVIEIYSTMVCGEWVYESFFMCYESAALNGMISDLVI